MGVNELINCRYNQHWNVKYRNADRYAARTRLLAYSPIEKVRVAPSRFQSLSFYSIIYGYTNDVTIIREILEGTYWKNTSVWVRISEN